MTNLNLKIHQKFMTLVCVWMHAYEAVGSVRDQPHETH